MKTSRWPISHLPISGVTPFTYRDGETYLSMLNRLAQYVTEQLHPSLRETVEHMVEELEHILAAQHSKYVEGVQDFQRIHDAFMTDVNSALMALNDNSVSDLVDDAGSTLGSTLRELFIAESKNEVQPTGDWTFTKGRATDDDDRQKVAVERTFRASQGDMYDSNIRLEFSVLRQQHTENNPPGYASAVIDLVDDRPDNDHRFAGYTNRIWMIGNRTLFNRRVEVNMGGRGRATLRSGIDPDSEYARLSLHNHEYPQVNVFGPNHPGMSGRGVVRVDRAPFYVNRAPGGLQMRIIMDPSSDQEGRTRHLDFTQFGNGSFRFRGFVNNENIGSVQWNPHDMRLSIGDPGRSFRAPGGISLRASNDRWYRIDVSDTGELSTTRIYEHDGEEPA